MKLLLEISRAVIVGFIAMVILRMLKDAGYVDDACTLWVALAAVLLAVRGRLIFQ